MGLRFRKNIEPVKGIRCKADIVFKKTKICIFIDGCFWHGCPQHFRPPKTHTEWWIEKVKDNIERDKRKTAIIEKNGWIVLRYWEHELKAEGAVQTAREIADVVKKRIEEYGKKTS